MFAGQRFRGCLRWFVSFQPLTLANLCLSMLWWYESFFTATCFLSFQNFCRNVACTTSALPPVLHGPDVVILIAPGRIRKLDSSSSLSICIQFHLPSSNHLGRKSYPYSSELPRVCFFGRRPLIALIPFNMCTCISGDFINVGRKWTKPQH